MHLKVVRFELSGNTVHVFVQYTINQQKWDQKQKRKTNLTSKLSIGGELVYNQAFKNVKKTKTIPHKIAQSELKNTPHTSKYNSVHTSTVYPKQKKKMYTVIPSFSLWSGIPLAENTPKHKMNYGAKCKLYMILSWSKLCQMSHIKCTFEATHTYIYTSNLVGIVHGYWFSLSSN